jgi:alpha-galactosidase
VLGEPLGVLGEAGSARTTAPYQVGWCSWYHYFHAVTEADLRANLARAADWPFDVFQLDDGFQSAIGDWLTTNADFPTSLDGLSSAIAAEGRVPGLWLAPFAIAPGSQLAHHHPDWRAVHLGSGAPLVSMVNEGWGGAVHTLDTSNLDVLDHLESVARQLVEAGFPYLKLDFTYAPSLHGGYADPSRTPAQRVRAGFEAIRRGAGPDTFLLGCGAPLGTAVGVVDGMRIGADVAPWWHARAEGWHPPGHEGGEPATVNAWRNTLSRSFLHRRLWLNDPDCLMLRTERTQLSHEQVRAWALAVGMSGGMALVSDDLALLDRNARALLDDVVALGRQADAAASRRDGHPPRCPDLLDVDPPTRLLAAGQELVGQPDRGTAYLQGLLA